METTQAALGLLIGVRYGHGRESHLRSHVLHSIRAFRIRERNMNKISRWPQIKSFVFRPVVEPFVVNKKMENSRKAHTTIAVTGLRGIPDVMGGIETHCKELLPRVKLLNPNYDIIVLGRSPYLEKKNNNYQGIKIIKIFTIKNKYLETILHTFISIFYARFVLNASVLHIHGIGPALMAPIAALLCLKIVVTHHGEDFNRKKWNNLAKFCLRVGEKFSIRYSQALIVVSEHVTRRLTGSYKNAAARIFHIPNGATTLDLAIIEQSSEKILYPMGLKPNGYILAVGRLVPEKNFDILIDAFLASGLDYDLVIAGAADHDDAYSMSLLKRERDNVKFIGFQSHASLAVLYRNAALFVLPSSHEGLPISALEAAAVGCRMLLSDIPANIEIGLSTAHYFPVGRTDVLALKLQGPFENYQVSSDAVTAKFDWASIAVSTSGLYEGVLSGR